MILVFVEAQIYAFRVSVPNDDPVSWYVLLSMALLKADEQTALNISGK